MTLTSGRGYRASLKIPKSGAEVGRAELARAAAKSVVGGPLHVIDDKDVDGSLAGF
jgi:hypothetical protein